MYTVAWLEQFSFWIFPGVRAPLYFVIALAHIHAYARLHTPTINVSRAYYDCSALRGCVDLLFGIINPEFRLPERDLGHRFSSAGAFKDLRGPAKRCHKPQLGPPFHTRRADVSLTNDSNASPQTVVLKDHMDDMPRQERILCAKWMICVA